MAIFNSSRTLVVGLVLICSSLFGTVYGKADSEILATFGDPIQLFGNMIFNDIDFVDGLKVQVYSPTNRTMTVRMNDRPLNGTFVTGTTGQGYRTVRGYSYMISTNEPANDLIAKIQIPYDPMRLQAASIDQADTYVARLSDDKKAWMVMDDRQTVQKNIFKTSMSLMTTIDGEYVILGRQSQAIGNMFIPFGNGDAFSANITGGPGRQDAEFMDGLRFAIDAPQALRLNVNLKYPIAKEAIPAGMMSLNTYSWVINTTVAANLNDPFNIPPPAVATLAPGGGVPNPNAPPMPPPGGATPGMPNAPGMPPMPGMPNAPGNAPPFPSFPGGFGGPFGKARRQAAGPAPIVQPSPNASSPSPNAPPSVAGTLTPASPAAGTLTPAPPAAGTLSPAPGAPSPTLGTPLPPSVATSLAPAVPPPSSAPAPAASPPAPVPIVPQAAEVNSAMIDFPVNIAQLTTMLSAMGMGNINPQQPSTMASLKFTIGRRDLVSQPTDKFSPMGMMATGNGNTGNQGNLQLQFIDGRLQFQGVQKLDGEYVILIPMDQGIGQSKGDNGTKQELGLKKTNAGTISKGVDWGWVFAVVAAVGGMLTL